MADEKYTFDLEALKKDSGGKLPTDSARFQSKHNGADRNHDKKDAVHRVVIDPETGFVVAQSVFIPRFNANGQRLGAEPSLVVAVTDRAFKLNMIEGEVNVTGPVKLVTYDAKDLEIDRKTNKATVKKDAKPVSGIVPTLDELNKDRPKAEQYDKMPKGNEYNFHAYLYLPEAKERAQTNVEFKQTKTPEKGKLDPVGEIVVVEGSSDISLESTRPMIYPLQVDNKGMKHSFTFKNVHPRDTVGAGFGAFDAKGVRTKGTDATVFQSVGPAANPQDPSPNPPLSINVQVNYLPERLAVGFAKSSPNPKEEDDRRRVLVVNKGKRMDDTDSVDKIRDVVEEVRRDIHNLPKLNPQQKPEEKKDEKPEHKKDEPLAALASGVANQIAQAVAAFTIGVTNPADMPQAKVRNSVERGK